jgi:hypothetical protein
VTFTVDGRETRSRIPGRACQADAESIETAAWEGETLALTVVGSVPPGGGVRTTVNVKRLLRLRSRDSLVVEAGMRASGESSPRQVATIYKRSSDALPAGAADTGARKAQATIAQVAWISGTWIGTAGPVTVEERWTPAASGTMLAVARTIRNGVMSAFEFLCISERDGGLVYTAMPNGRPPATDFTLTAITSDSATFENPAHDFPKLVRYARRPDGTLETTVGGDPAQRPATFVLERQR